MTENEFLLEDRITKINSVFDKYGAENFYVSWSGGKDSQVVSKLIDLAVPGNRIPRLYIDTGLDLKIMRDFVKEQQKKDDRIIIIEPQVNVRDTLENVGYPFKSKEHSAVVNMLKQRGTNKTVERYFDVNNRHGCPKKLRYQYQPDFKLKISDRCCTEMKEKPIKIWSKKNKIPYTITGLMASEGGRRRTTPCLSFRNGLFKKFHPLAPMSKEWEDWFIEEYNVEICDIYKPPYNFERTGCKGCPFAIDLQKGLDTLSQYFPAERKQCEIIWKPVYDEYRRIGYRLRKK